MDEMLYEASRNGSVDSLKKLIAKDPLIFDRVPLASYSHETPLHIAAMLGHGDIVREFLHLKPELASESDSQGRSPLHLASAKGHVDIVRELLMKNTKVCSVRDQDGRTPLHLAAMGGRVDVIKELLVGVTKITEDQGETAALHLCVEYNRLEALKVLVESVTDDDEFINSKDDNGKTVSDLAKAKNQKQIIKYLATRTGEEVNAFNSNGSTTVDIPDSPQGSSSKKQFQNHGDWLKSSWLKKKREAVMVAATVIAAMALQVGLSPPGGVWQENSKEKDGFGNPLYYAGTSILAHNNPAAFHLVMAFNTVSFVNSLSLVLLLISGLPFKHRIYTWILLVSMWINISFMGFTYIVAVSSMARFRQRNRIVSLIGIRSPPPTFPNKAPTPVYDLSINWIAFFMWLGFITIIFLIHTVRLVLWVVREVLIWRKWRLSSSPNERKRDI
ncbi:hypothetical protein HHK36_025448 [Tetracentron sinense]|uniref:PGG domain-containing protein n=1 Tax=Tetracentron sinense TaxID=13715 RepID=A0A835D353_TETSI|nr:hypothetical protein HHK36_025448 [Tetracentron sinense]